MNKIISSCFVCYNYIHKFKKPNSQEIIVTFAGSTPSLVNEKHQRFITVTRLEKKDLKCLWLFDRLNHKTSNLFLFINCFDISTAIGDAFTIVFKQRTNPVQQNKLWKQWWETMFLSISADQVTDDLDTFKFPFDLERWQHKNHLWLM